MSKNPLLTESTLPFNYPHFDQIKNEHFSPAFETGMLEHRKEVETVSGLPGLPTFENTVVALEKSGELLGRVSRVFYNLAGTITNPDIQKIEREMAPKLAAHSDTIRLNPGLFKRIEWLHKNQGLLGLDPESARLLDRYYKDFVRSGAKLSEEEKTKLKGFNSELATLHTSFAQSLLKESNVSGVLVERREDLEGLSENAITAAALAAKESGQAGKYLIRLLNTSSQPALDSLKNRALRERLYRASVERCSRGGTNDTRLILSRIARIRAERSQLLGYAHHAALQLEEQTAGNVEAVNGLLGRLAPAAVENARRESKELQDEMHRDGGTTPLQAWDWAYYSERVRKARYAFDASELRPYFEMSRVLRDGVFFAATKLYGITFKERLDLPKYHPDTSIWEVFNEDGTSLAIFIVDWYARPTKRGGAWANAYVSQSHLTGRRPVVANHLNIPKPADGESTLMTNDEVVTAFHEFGHALHAMFSDVRYPRFSGTSVPRDFVEFPSQVNEMWATWPEVLQNFARHYKTGELLPASLLEKVKAAEQFNQGYQTTEYLAASLLDQAWHQLKPEEVPSSEFAMDFESKALAKAGVDFAPVPPRYRSPYFSHIFSSNGYAAGYYSYIWSEVLDADNVDWFKSNGGLNRTNGERYRRMLLSRGGSLDAKEMYRNFAGRDPDVRHLLDRRGLNRSPETPK